MKNKKLIWQLPFLVLLIIGTIFIIRQQQSVPYQQNNGLVFGTTYSLKYQSKLNDASSMELPARSVVTVVAQLSNATGIHGTLSPKSSDNKYYTLNGHPTSHPTKGVHIYNGQIYIVR